MIPGISLWGPVAFQNSVMGINRLVSGPPSGPVKEQATAIVNMGEAAMVQNLENYQDANISQTTALMRFDELWATMETALRSPRIQQYGIGARSIAERNRGGVYDYFQRYRDPIVDNPRGSLGELLDKAPGGEVAGVPVVWLLAFAGLFGFALLMRKRS